jgi:hypothetical protein
VSLSPPALSDFTFATQTGGPFTLPGSGPGFSVAGHAVQYDGARGRWFADIEMSPLGPTAYFPFVKLSVCRWQPNSVAGVELSSPIVLDVVQTVPDRVLTVDLTHPPNVTVNVTGPVEFLGGYGGALGLPNVMQAAIQQQIGGTDEINWQNVAGPVTLSRTDLFPPADSVGSWAGVVVEPSGPGPYRLVVTEYEQYYTGPSSPGSTSPGGLAQRPVYSDVLGL